METHANITSKYMELINLLERGWLDSPTHGVDVNSTLTEFRIKSDDNCFIIEYNSSVPSKFRGYILLRVSGILEFISEEKAQAEKLLMEDVIMALYGQNISFGYLIQGFKNEVCIYFIVFRDGNNVTDLKNELKYLARCLETNLRATYPGIKISLSEKNVLSTVLGNTNYLGILTGIPTTKIGTETFGVEQIEKIGRGLYGDEWWYLVVAEPILESEVNNISHEVMNEVIDSYKEVKTTKREGVTQTARTIEEIDRFAQYYVELLEKEILRINSGKAEGMWKTFCYLGASTQSTFGKEKALLKGIFSGEDSIPEPIRIHDINSKSLQKFKPFVELLNELKLPDRQSTHPFGLLIPHNFVTMLTSRELSVLTSLPKQEMPGYNVEIKARFGVSAPDIVRTPGNDKILIGEIMDLGEITNNTLYIREDLLTKHGLIVGTTGSGKTNTCFQLLMQLRNKREGKTLPFLIIEPTKGEYRNLIDAFKPDMRVYTLGEETSPLRMNPFEVAEGVHVQTHLDNLKAAFNAGFMMYPPMPYVLEQCLINVYEKRGWNLAEDERGETPTLRNLYYEVDAVVKGLGYDKQISMNVRAALKTRIRSLLVGGKGRMLNCKKSSPSIKEMLSHPTVLELKNIADNEEKAFVMALIASNIYEYRESQQNKERISNKLCHITLLEEAHRLLTNVGSVTGSSESNQSKAKAVETLCNMLKEVRAYGECILIADQIPTKLAPDAIKNTNLKIIHKLISGDDREEIAQSIGLSEIQKKFLINIPVGNAVVFFEDLDAPYMVLIPYIKEKVVEKNDNEIKNYMNKEHRLSAEQEEGPFLGCNPCKNKCAYSFLVEPIINDEDICEQVNKSITEFFNNIKKGEKNKISDLDKIHEFIARKTIGLHTNQDIEKAKEITSCALVQILNNLDFEPENRERNITYFAWKKISP